jgi:hypothetical protein
MVGVLMEMTMKILLCSLLLVGCAHGVSDPVDVEAETNVVQAPPRSPSVPSQPDPVVNESSTEGKNCEVVQKVYADNCVLEVIKCTDGSIHFDSYCFGPPYVPVWKWVPDPPYKSQKDNNNE